MKKDLHIPDRVLVAGLGASGVSCVKLLAGLGKKVTATDMRREGELSGALKALDGVPFEAGSAGTASRISSTTGLSS